MGDGTLLEVKDLRTCFDTDAGVVWAVDGVSWSLARGETLALVGESGCGKSATALSLMGLIATPPGRIVSGRVLFRDDPSVPPQDLLAMNERQIRRIRGNRIAMIFQEAMSALNPVFTIGDQIAEALELHQKVTRRQALEAAVGMLEKVGIGAPDQRIGQYPHQISGGMAQRVMIAMAICCRPSLLIADEPTTSLDVTVEAQILDLLRTLQASTGMGLVIITHDLGVVAQIADQVAVMYAGRIVERAPVGELFDNPLHPYTRALLHALPPMAPSSDRLAVIPGEVPDPLCFPMGCRFHPRCDVTRQRAAEASRIAGDAPGGPERVRVLNRCLRHGPNEPGGDPELRQVRPGHHVACWEVEGYTAACPNPGDPGCDPDGKPGGSTKGAKRSGDTT